MRWAAYIGLAASLIAAGSTVFSYRGRRWMGTLVSVLALIVGLTPIAIPMAWQRRAQRLPSIHDITTDLENPPTFEAILAKRVDAPNRLARTPEPALPQKDVHPAPR